MHSRANYRFSPTLLDTFNGYLNCEEVWSKYWGNSENPSKTLEEFRQEKFQDLIDRINRKEIAWEDTELMDRGTAFNEVIDCIILNTKSKAMQIYVEDGYIVANYNKRVFRFDVERCKQIAARYKGIAQTQVFIEGYIPTRYGAVRFVGYIDELMLIYISDLKTTKISTSKPYAVGKYKGNMQHHVYPIILEQMGQKVDYFLYDIVCFDDKTGEITETYEEVYTYRKEISTTILTDCCEAFIEFVEANRHLITDLKIFNQC